MWTAHISHTCDSASTTIFRIDAIFFLRYESTMKLVDWLEKVDCTPDELAQIAGIHRATVYRLLKNADYVPTVPTIRAIEQATFGAVKLRDLVP